MRLLPHRYPFLLVDRVTEFAGETCRAIKNVTINEPFFVGHFPGHPVMPGVLILEAMAQTAAVHACLKLGKQAGEQAFYLVSMDKARFRKPVVPGDQLILTTTLCADVVDLEVPGEVHVGGVLVSEAEFMATLPSAPAQMKPAAIPKASQASVPSPLLLCQDWNMSRHTLLFLAAMGLCACNPRKPLPVSKDMGPAVQVLDAAPRPYAGTPATKAAPPLAETEPNDDREHAQRIDPQKVIQDRCCRRRQGSRQGR